MWRNWPSSLSSLLCAAKVKLGRVRATFGWVTVKVLTKPLTPPFFRGDVKLGILYPYWKKGLLPLAGYHVKCEPLPRLWWSQCLTYTIEQLLKGLDIYFAHSIYHFYLIFMFCFKSNIYFSQGYTIKKIFRA